MPNEILKRFYNLQIRSYENILLAKNLLPRSTEEEYGIRRLLWYLNSGGKRSYEIVARPDKEEHKLKRPDFVCKDSVTGTYITVEITRIIHHLKALEVKAHKIRVWYEIAKLLERKLPGAYELTLPVRLDTHGMPSKRLAKDIADIASKLAVGDTVQLTRNLKLTKKDVEGSFLTHVEEMEDENEEEPIQLMTNDQVIRAIERPLQETSEKFNAFAQGLRILLLDSQDIPLDVLDINEISNQILRDQYPSIDRVYLLNTPRYGNILLFWS